ncbi:hypothetical protein SDC9_130978 [bioreactor metagenome]|uniref:Uncharacterized protein n=1 Tax=bioreactor metagenome TaxID=1076179 RepID=A0A645D4B6_9ZZZZ
MEDINDCLKKYPWMDFYVVGLNEIEMIIYATMDSSQGYQLSISLNDVSYIDMPMRWKIDTEEEYPIKSIFFSSMEKKDVDRFLDNGAGNLYCFSAETVLGKAEYHIAAKNLTFTDYGVHNYQRWEGC